jgi:hypothetical protein
MHHVRFKAQPPGCFDLRSTGIDSDYFATEVSKFFRQHSISTTEIENALTSFWRKEL